MPMRTNQPNTQKKLKYPETKTTEKILLLRPLLGQVIILEGFAGPFAIAGDTQAFFPGSRWATLRCVLATTLSQPSVPSI